MLKLKAALVASFVAFGATASAGTLLVERLGDQGWVSGDTRKGDIGGSASNSVQLTSPADGAEIATRISFAKDPAPSTTQGGALRLQTDVASGRGQGDKATLENRSLSIDPFDPAIEWSYDWYREPGGGAAAPALKLGIDTSEPNPTSATAVARGENRFDKILVYEPYQQGPTQASTWTTEFIDFDGTGAFTGSVATAPAGRFWLVNLVPQGQSALRFGYAPSRQAELFTLQEWQAKFDNAAFPPANPNDPRSTPPPPMITSIQIAIGSGNPGQDSYVDSLQLTTTAFSMLWSFGNPTSSATAPITSNVAPTNLGNLPSGDVGGGGCAFHRRKQQPGALWLLALLGVLGVLGIRQRRRFQTRRARARPSRS